MVQPVPQFTENKQTESTMRDKERRLHTKRTDVHAGYQHSSRAVASGKWHAPTESTNAERKTHVQTCAAHRTGRASKSRNHDRRE